MAAPVVWNGSIDPAGAMAGTLTCVAHAADDPERFYALGAAHVLAPLAGQHAVRGPLPGDRVFCRFDPGAAPREIGALAYWQDLQPRSSGFANRMDVAMVDIDRNTAAELRQQVEANCPGNQAELARLRRQHAANRAIKRQLDRLGQQEP